MTGQSAIPKIEWTVTAGNLGQMVLVAVGLIIWVVHGSTQAERTTQDTDTLKTSMTAQFAAVNVSMDTRFDKMQLQLDSRFKDIQTQISLIPTVGLQLATLDKRLSNVEDTNRSQDGRLNQDEQTLAVLRNNIENVGRAVGAPVQPVPNARH